MLPWESSLRTCLLRITTHILDDDILCCERDGERCRLCLKEGGCEHEGMRGEQSVRCLVFAAAGSLSFLSIRQCYLHRGNPITKYPFSSFSSLPFYGSCNWDAGCSSKTMTLPSSASLGVSRVDPSLPFRTFSKTPISPDPPALSHSHGRRDILWWSLVPHGVYETVRRHVFRGHVRGQLCRGGVHYERHSLRYLSTLAACASIGIISSRTARPRGGRLSLAVSDRTSTGGAARSRRALRHGRPRAVKRLSEVRRKTQSKYADWISGMPLQQSSCFGVQHGEGHHKLEALSIRLTDVSRYVVVSRHEDKAIRLQKWSRWWRTQIPYLARRREAVHCCSGNMAAGR